MYARAPLPCFYASPLPLFPKVDEVKLKMQENFDIVLKNLATSEKIVEDSARLHGQAKMFEKNAQKLKRSERCKNYKMNAIIAAVIIIILMIIIIPIATSGGTVTAAANVVNNKTRI